MDRIQYIQLLGKLNYLANSRPDIITSLSYAATKSINPSTKDYANLLQIVSYLRQTPEYGITLYPRKPDDDDKLYLTAFVDAAYMSHTDAMSHTGYCVSLGSIKPQSYFLAKSSKQKCVATSSTHAEIRALYDLTINIVYLLTLFEEIGRPIEVPVDIYEDNQSTIDLVNSVNTKITKSKHYLMLIQYLREQVNLGIIKIRKVDGTENLSDVLTKLITNPTFFTAIAKIMGLKQVP